MARRSIWSDARELRLRPALIADKIAGCALVARWQEDTDAQTAPVQ
jgi:hypothetical protein